MGIAAVIIPTDLDMFILGSPYNSSIKNTPIATATSAVAAIYIPVNMSLSALDMSHLS
tara:strand:- start:1276 stop:1449 length:174 start_codon:yes stop_codon:yes gene_type:complete